jgi:hypothetical protein
MPLKTMVSCFMRHRGFLFPSILLFAAMTGSLGCADEPAVNRPVPSAVVENSASITLRTHFPERATHVLESPLAFVARDHRFVPNMETKFQGWQRLDVDLPREASDAIVIRAPGGFTLRVREVGLRGEGKLAERAVAYASAHGTSYWSATTGGAEEWLHVESGLARRGEVLAAWEVDGAARVETHGKAIGFFDDGGVARVWVTAPVAYSVTGRQIVPALSVQGTRIELSLDANGEEVLVDPSWSTVAPMAIARGNYPAVLLQNGKVVAAGGSGGANAEVYDPVANIWTATGPMVQSRGEHRGILLDNGKVLVTPGTGAITTSNELYDPVTNTWTAAGPMPLAVNFPAIVKLADGRGLSTGGFDGSSPYTKGAWLFAPSSATWTNAGPMVVGRAYHTLTRLANGHVLAAGGQSTFGTDTATAEVYDPATNTWTAVLPMATARRNHAAALLQNGRVLVFGGENAGGSVNTAELYDPVSKSFSSAGMIAGQTFSTLTLMGDGNVLMGGGLNATTSTQLYLPGTNTWMSAGNTSALHGGASAVLLAPNKVLLVGGGTTSVEVYGPSANGTVCTVNTDCSSNFCVDGVCCNSACLTVCQACNVMGNVGTCSNLPAGQKDNFPINHCNDGINSCNGMGGCRKDNGQTCMGATECWSNFCVDGRCCNTACNGGACDACSTAAGAPTNGTCALLTGTLCNDSNACTQTDTCQAGTCIGANPVVCTPMDTCHVAGMCNTSTGMCSNPNAPNGTPCTDSNACTQTDACQSGACTGANPVLCAAMDQCHVAGACNTSTGMCDDPVAPDGTKCNDGNPCTQTDACQTGACLGANPLQCPAIDACHDSGSCDMASGTCINPAKPVGTQCAAGACEGTIVYGPSLCDDAGSCLLGPDKDCAPFGCNMGACNVSCLTALDCAPNAGCVKDVCTFDPDGDGIDTDQDTCADDANPLQTDTDGDKIGDVCDDDDDNDKILDAADNCPLFANSGQEDSNSDGIGDACDCANPVKPDKTACDDRNACTQSDICQSGSCTGTNPVVCPSPSPCEQGVCNSADATCYVVPRPDKTPCPGGVCIAGGCFQGSSSASSGSSSGSAGAGVGGAASGGNGGNGGNGEGGLGGSNGNGGNGVGVGGQNGTGASSGNPTFGGAACGCRIDSSESEKPLWCGLGILVLGLRRRRSSSTKPV